MKEVIIAFDVDGTILNNQGVQPGTPLYQRFDNGVNLEIALLMEILSRKMKNVKIIVWSGGGQDHAEMAVRKYGLTKFVSGCYDKHTYDETIDGKVDIAFDDIHEFNMATNNIIVKMK